MARTREGRQAIGIVRSPRMVLTRDEVAPAGHDPRGGESTLAVGSTSRRVLPRHGRCDGQTQREAEALHNLDSTYYPLSMKRPDGGEASWPLPCRPVLLAAPVHRHHPRQRRTTRYVDWGQAVTGTWHVGSRRALRDAGSAPPGRRMSRADARRSDCIQVDPAGDPPLCHCDASRYGVVPQPGLRAAACAGPAPLPGLSGGVIVAVRGGARIAAGSGAYACLGCDSRAGGRGPARVTG
jgi:hypothetical protein